MDGDTLQHSRLKLDISAINRHIYMCNNIPRVFRNHPNLTGTLESEERTEFRRLMKEEQHGES